MKNYYHIIRPINIFLVLLTQLVMFYLVLVPIFESQNLDSILTGAIPLLMMFATAMAGASGFVVNDIMDINADMINKPDRTFIGPGRMSVRDAWIYYGVLVLLGAIAVTYVIFSLKCYAYFWIYPLSVFILYIYSTHLKGLPLVGNILVALYAIAVPGIFFLGEKDTIDNITDAHFQHFIRMVIYGYLASAFTVNLLRELIKDIEDIEGDIQQNYLTLPAIIGANSIKKYVFTISLLTLIPYIFWFGMLSNHPYKLSFAILIAVFMLLPNLILIYLIYFAHRREDFTNLSKWLKVLMVASIVVFIGVSLSYLQ